MSKDKKLFAVRRHLLMTLDPVHIGTGGTSLGRVDNSIVREPGTRLPKIPGTSLSGAVRQYAAYRYSKRDCAGQGGHCGRPTCPICYTFGFVKGEGSDQKAHSGVVSIGDARLVLFPVYSLAGPVWVTSPGVLRDWGVTEADPGDKVRLPEALSKHAHLNLGWLMLEKDDAVFQWPAGIQGVPDEVVNRTLLVSDKLFSQIVNSNLEVRTSVSINPETGAAEEHKLFTYEAIPRAALLWLDVVVDDYRRDPTTKQSEFPVVQNKARAEQRQDKQGKDYVVYFDNQGDPLGETWQGPLDVVTAGLALAEHLGIGGMGTRGFGRIKLLGDWEVNHA